VTHVGLTLDASRHPPERPRIAGAAADHVGPATPGRERTSAPSHRAPGPHRLPVRERRRAGAAVLTRRL